MLKRFLIGTLPLLFIFVMMTGCKDLDEMNNDPTRPTTTEPPFLLTGAEKNAMDFLYSSLQNGYIGMHYAQYWSANSRVNDSQYAIDENNNTAFWNALYNSLHSLDRLIYINNSRGTNPAAKNQNAIAGILKVWLYQILTDSYVNVPFTEALKEGENITPAYDDQSKIYASLIDTLNAQITALDPAQPTFDGGDVIYNGDVAKWKTLGHSLMLRLAIRMADAEPQRARTVIEANYAAAMKGNADNAEFAYINAAPNKFPLNDSEREVLDFFVSTTLVDYMRSTNDPRLTVYARPPQDGGEIKGLEYGRSANDSTRLPQRKYSYPGTRIYSATMPGILMTYPEVAFILAEAAARNWNVGEAAPALYEKGIRASMEYWNVTDSVEEYIASVPYNAGNWKNVIGTQKWLALYPQGFQAWFERLRLDFQKPSGDSLFIAPYSGSLDQNVAYVPARLTYPLAERSQNAAAYQKAAEAIGGDTKASKNWWDKF
ncbi:SusD/RagB family nutrient-binding outer membrane lipoprotein [Chitinophaga rhizophila]|uniref:SusD/RagB family nutrient-binding outer membrane lipoprotein n=1 Tax=Chitinophaga rhizophila TaxID=2866212 RepID=A0ABS7GG07_9BACT|nr:SusD/RagB family nutrient-binding outer membrane lipoprotein [Chitinophaga rhizophila]MBW8685739.1 SusD/RagB family nutrient-binding outer membrane lipoprotein [Chitinophaga rhizophila]